MGNVKIIDQNKYDQHMGHKVSSNKNTIWKWEKADLDARLFVVGGLEWEQTGTGWPQYYKLCVNVYNYQYMFKYKSDRTSMALPVSWGPRCFAIVCCETNRTKLFKFLLHDGNRLIETQILKQTWANRHQTWLMRLD